MTKKIFITGTDTDIGKTIVSSWLCLHFNYSYWKPIQTGYPPDSDIEQVKSIACNKCFKESYLYKTPVSPHLAARLENDKIDLANINMPTKLDGNYDDNLIIEGAGGVLVPLNDDFMMIDLIKKLATPVIIVARTGLGTINHTCLTINILRNYDIPILGVIMSSSDGLGINNENSKAIAHYGKVEILAELDFPKINKHELFKIKPGKKLSNIFLGVK